MTEETPQSAPPAPPEKARAAGLAWLVILAVAALDQLSKWAVIQWVMNHPNPRGVEVFHNLLYFHYKRNPGVAFSMFQEHPEILTVVTTVAVILISWWAWQVPQRERLARFAFGLILGGAVGNLIDRWTRGYVVDFIDFIFPGVLGRWHDALFGSRHFATFNIADSAICIGMGLLVFALIFLTEHEKKKEPTPEL